MGYQVGPVQAAWISQVKNMTTTWNYSRDENLPERRNGRRHTPYRSGLTGTGTWSYIKSMATAYYGYDEHHVGLYNQNGEYYDALMENGPYRKCGDSSTSFIRTTCST